MDVASRGSRMRSARSGSVPVRGTTRAQKTSPKTGNVFPGGKQHVAGSVISLFASRTRKVEAKEKGRSQYTERLKINAAKKLMSAPVRRC